MKDDRSYADFTAANIFELARLETPLAMDERTIPLLHLRIHY